MKFLSYLAKRSAFSVLLLAQDVPNGGFEDWATFTGSGKTGSYNYDLPDFWKTTDSVSMANGPLQRRHPRNRECAWRCFSPASQTWPQHSRLLSMRLFQV